MPEPLRGATGERMELDDYYADFERVFWRTGEFWKLERGQVFAEPGDESWTLFNRGDWAGSLRVMEARRDDLTAYHREAAEAGVTARRIRIVERPLSAYMQWELHHLKIRDETGGPIRVLDASAVADIESGGPMPEIYTLGTEVMYQAVYDGSGVLEHVVRYTDQLLVHRCRDFIGALYERGEPVADYFAREVAPLPPPVPDDPLPEGYLDRTGRPGPIRS
ncbi:DUF6879 family protein [Catenuloplanes sp. NPDC051500]|uniref:DUF6879 family protein n=1 Tax=Catenuloplanes sp. NPDC051500 TaxID=3363959 RepID=UPI00378EA357